MGVIGNMDWNIGICRYMHITGGFSIKIPDLGQDGFTPKTTFTRRDNDSATKCLCRGIV